MRAWRTASLDDVRDEVERVFGVTLEACHDKVYDGAPAFAHELPGCELRLSSWPSIAPGVDVFNLIGLERRDGAPDQTGDDVSCAVVGRLHDEGLEWYLPHRNEYLFGGGALGDKVLDADELVAMMAPRWLNWLDEAERARAVQHLLTLVGTWISAASRAVNPSSELTRRWAAFEAVGAAYRGEPRLAVIEAHARRAEGDAATARPLGDEL